MSRARRSAVVSVSRTMRSLRDYIAIADGRERDYLIIEVIDQRAALGRGWVRDVRQEIVFEGEDG